jgi:hypothetical protein
MLRHPPPILASQVSDEWLQILRSIASRHEGHVLRQHPTLPRIQSWAVNYGQWADTLLPTSAIEFVSVEERDECWSRLWKVQ